MKMAKCQLCGSNQDDAEQYGEILSKGGMSVHTYCLYLSSNLAQRGKDDEGFLGFLQEDIRTERERVASVRCCYCGCMGANVGCCDRKCRRSFHTICGIENFALNQFFGTYRSYCNRHVRKIPFRPSPNEICAICYDQLHGADKRFRSVIMLFASCCRNGWFHKLCMQRFANTAGYFFKCPLCNNRDVFRGNVALGGIFIPERDAAWELEPNAYGELLERPNRCAAEQCSVPGRSGSGDALLLCETCGSVAMHRRCMPNARSQFQCDNCRQLLTADSGRESMQSLQEVENCNGNEEDIELDVCGHSDAEKEDTENGALQDSVTQLSAEEKQQQDEAEVESDVGRAQVARLRKRYINRICSSDDDDESDAAAVERKRKKCKRKTALKTRRLTDTDDTSTDDDEFIQFNRKHLSKASYGCNGEGTIGQAAIKHIVLDGAASDSDDPLENFATIMDKLRVKATSDDISPQKLSTQQLSTTTDERSPVTAAHKSGSRSSAQRRLVLPASDKNGISSFNSNTSTHRISARFAANLHCIRVHSDAEKEDTENGALQDSVTQLSAEEKQQQDEAEVESDVGRAQVARLRKRYINRICSSDDDDESDAAAVERKRKKCKRKTALKTRRLTDTDDTSSDDDEFIQFNRKHLSKASYGCNGEGTIGQAAIKHIVLDNATSDTDVPLENFATIMDKLRVKATSDDISVKVSTRSNQTEHVATPICSDDSEDMNRRLLANKSKCMTIEDSADEIVESLDNASRRQMVSSLESQPGCQEDSNTNSRISALSIRNQVVVKLKKLPARKPVPSTTPAKRPRLLSTDTTDSLLNVSCIARRTRRRSNVTSSSASLNMSFIAQRTRHTSTTRPTPNRPNYAESTAGESDIDSYIEDTKTTGSANDGDSTNMSAPSVRNSSAQSFYSCSSTSAITTTTTTSTALSTTTDERSAVTAAHKSGSRSSALRRLVLPASDENVPDDNTLENHSHNKFVRSCRLLLNANSENRQRQFQDQHQEQHRSQRHMTHALRNDCKSL